jgi:methionyl-tRNA synthetase
VTSDVIARYERKRGKNVFFLTGTDEHGQKVQQSALTAGESPQQFADNVSAKFKQLVEMLNCSHDDFIRTTETRHRLSVETLWRKLEENGQIYLSTYEGWYSVRDEAFFPEDTLVDGRAPTGAPVQWVKEECYFFRLSNWTDKLLEHYAAHPDFISPSGRINEVVQFIMQQGGLKDLSISRTTFDWGIPVPQNPKHVIYVWLDALANYISAIGYPDYPGHLKVLWPAALHVIGKDILRFHAIYWPAFLMACGMEVPKRIFAHGWWTRDGQKMSKSVGNVIDPFDLIHTYGSDAVRYFLVSEIPFGNDGDFSHKAFVQRVNTDLANDFGNLVHRTCCIIKNNFEGRIPRPVGEFTEADKAVLNLSIAAMQNITKHLDNLSLHMICLEILVLARAGNKYVNEQAPWALLKTDLNRAATVMYVLSELIRRINILLEPITPTACGKLFQQMGIPPDMRSFESLTDMIAPGTDLNELCVIFPRCAEPPEPIHNDKKKRASPVEPKIHRNPTKQAPKKETKSNKV